MRHVADEGLPGDVIMSACRRDSQEVLSQLAQLILTMDIQRIRKIFVSDRFRRFGQLRDGVN